MNPSINFQRKQVQTPETHVRPAKPLCGLSRDLGPRVPSLSLPAARIQAPSLGLPDPDQRLSWLVPPATPRGDPGPATTAQGRRGRPRVADRHLAGQGHRGLAEAEAEGAPGRRHARLGPPLAQEAPPAQPERLTHPGDAMSAAAWALPPPPCLRGCRWAPGRGLQAAPACSARASGAVGRAPGGGQAGAWGEGEDAQGPEDLRQQPLARPAARRLELTCRAKPAPEPVTGCQTGGRHPQPPHSDLNFCKKSTFSSSGV